jgi:hypothetical protein
MQIRRTQNIHAFLYSILLYSILVPLCEARPTCHSWQKKVAPFSFTAATMGFQASTWLSVKMPGVSGYLQSSTGCDRYTCITSVGGRDMISTSVPSLSLSLSLSLALSLSLSVCVCVCVPPPLSFPSDSLPPRAHPRMGPCMRACL